MFPEGLHLQIEYHLAIVALKGFGVTHAEISLAYWTGGPPLHLLLLLDIFLHFILLICSCQLFIFVKKFWIHDRARPTV